MEFAPVEELEITPLAQAVDGFSAALDQLILQVDNGALHGLDANELVGFLQAFETVRNKIPAVDHAAIQMASDLGVPHTLCQRSMTRVLTQALRLSASDAGRRVRAAQQLGNRRALTGASLPPLRPHLAAAQRRGEISAEQVGVVDRGLRAVDHPGFDPADVEAGEEILARQARTLGPGELKIATQAVVDRIDPDGSLPDDDRLRQARHFRMSHQTDGSVKGEFHLTAELGEKLKAVLDPLSAPRTTCLTTGGLDDNGEPAGTTVLEPDERTRGQRLHDAVEQMCDRLLRSTALPDSGGTPATAIVHINLDDLLGGAGGGRLSDGTRISLAHRRDARSGGDRVVPGRRERRRARSWSFPPDRQPSPDPRADRQGRRLLLSWLRCRARVVRAAPRHVMARRWTHRSRQPDVAVSISPPELRATWMDLPDHG